MSGVADRLFVDLTADGRVSVSTGLGSEFLGGETEEQHELAWPLDADALEELRWYLEDYLRAPFGAYETRGHDVAAKLAPWGEAVFEAVFGPEPARTVYQQMQGGQAGLHIVFRSPMAQLLALPWELMRDPALGHPLALNAVAMDRSLPAAELPASFETQGDRLRVLMVISRPAGAMDVAFQMIARPLLARLAAVRGTVDMVVLRPPTLDALVATLTEAMEQGMPFQVVHFDGHGAMAAGRPPRAGELRSYQAQQSEGVLVFQRPDGGPDIVSASSVAQVLAAARVPVVVLNACQSGAIGRHSEAAVATRLLQGGAASVVAMAYSVYAVAAAEFMAAFYERVFAGDTVSAAVAAGRQRLFRHDRRPSPKGDMPLADWMIPVHYLRREVRFPGLVTARTPDAPSLDEALNRLSGQAPESVSGTLTPASEFVGRDGLFYELETAARVERVVVLYGPAGTGKSELAKAFGRWWRDTGGVERPEWVFWHSFEPGLASLGLIGVITEIGLEVFGPDFARADEVERLGLVESFLHDRCALLIWDNFESIRSVPDPSGAAVPLDDAGCRQLRGFLHRLAEDGRSAVLITSRSDEAWLDGISQGPMRQSGLRRIRVGGLRPHEAVDYANQLLAPYPAAAARRTDRAFAELMEWLDGHPLSMRLILPHLDTVTPKALLDGLRGSAPLPGWDEGWPGRVTSLAVGLSYSYAHLNAETRRLLWALCLFQGAADFGVMAAFSAQDNVPVRFRGISRQAWSSVMDAAARVGLLTRLNGAIYRIHPALPAFLAAQWRRENQGGYEAERAAATRALLSAYESFGSWLTQQIDSGDAGFAFSVIGPQQRTMGQLLGYALTEGLWHEAQLIAQPLSDYWRAQGRFVEQDAWTHRVRLAVEDSDGNIKDLNGPAGSLWFFFVSTQAGDLIINGNVDAANHSYRSMLDLTLSQPASSLRQSRLSPIYGQLAMVARLRGHLDEAADWASRALSVDEELHDRPRVARTYGEFGAIAQQRGYLEKAKEWYLKALVIEEELGDRPGMARDYHAVGTIAQQRGSLDEATSWYVKALAIFEELGDRRNMISSFHQLGMVALELEHLDEAVSWSTRALAIAEIIGNRHAAATSYFQLGTIALNRGRLTEAADWCTRSLSIFEELGDRTTMAHSYDQLGTVAFMAGQMDEAVHCFSRSLAIEEDLNDQPGMATSYHQLGVVALIRGQLDEAADWFARSLAITEELRDGPKMARTYSQLGLLAEKRGNLGQALLWTVYCMALSGGLSHLGAGVGPELLVRLTQQLGTEALEDCWLKVTGEPLPDVLRELIRSLPPHTG
jgi:tetratricopeptide (TPR) repeat protein